LRAVEVSGSKGAVGDRRARESEYKVLFLKAQHALITDDVTFHKEAFVAVPNLVCGILGSLEKGGAVANAQGVWFPRLCDGACRVTASLLRDVGFAGSQGYYAGNKHKSCNNLPGD
jgi:hypothetical protein